VVLQSRFKKKQIECAQGPVRKAVRYLFAVDSDRITILAKTSMNVSALKDLI